MMEKRYYEWSLLLLRLTLGIIFLAHGWQKINGFEQVAKFFASLGLPGFLIYFVVTIETLGGLFLLLGIFTRLAAAGIAAVMVGAIATVKAQAGLVGGYEFELTLLIGAVALALSGSELFSVQTLWKKNRQN
ncbi:MAG: DoxX family protein [Sporomusaceae bacterium]|nr:DoxX family protein [Sporomusaceae bacterium]